MLRVWILAMAFGAAAEPSAGDRFAAIAVRVLGYDRGLSSRAGEFVELLVVATPETLEARRTSFGALDGVRVQGLPLRVTTLAVTDDVAAAVRNHHPAAVFVEGGADVVVVVVGAVASAAFERPPLVFVRERALLGHGAHLAITLVEGRPRLVASLPALQAAHIELSSDVLKLADVVR